jgi:hypothetical protein
LAPENGKKTLGNSNHLAKTLGERMGGSSMKTDGSLRVSKHQKPGGSLILLF